MLKDKGREQDEYLEDTIWILCLNINLSFQHIALGFIISFLQDIHICTHVYIYFIRMKSRYKHTFITQEMYVRVNLNVRCENMMIRHTEYSLYLSNFGRKVLLQYVLYIISAITLVNVQNLHWSIIHVLCSISVVFDRISCFSIFITYEPYCSTL